MSTIIDYGMYLDTLTEVDKMVSYSLSIQQGETSFGNMSDETKVLHTRVETRYFDMCRNLNRASQYTNVTINCLK
ncbi:MAG: hypothetical protein KKE71_02200, partial [Nanoarchaeota archaeon]|nr:hypothetical protein [Nanoarchaeota archaeon]